MVWHLVKDVVWRNRRMYLSMCPLVIFTWALVGFEFSTPNWGIWIGLMVAIALGPMSSFTTVGPREVRILPVVSRDIWTAAWLMSTVVAAVACGASASLGIFLTYLVRGNAVVGVSALPLFTLYTFTYGGLALLALTALLTLVAWMNSKAGGGLWSTVTFVAFTSVSALLFGLPYLLSPYTPVTLGQFGPPHVVLLTLSLLIVVGSLIRMPRRGGALGRQNPVAARPRSTRRPTARYADRFTGLSRVAWSHACLVVGSLVWLVILDLGFRRFLEDDTRTLTELLQSVGYPLVGAASAEGPSFLIGIVLVLGVHSPWAGHLRHMKVLPISATQLTGLCVVTPLLTIFAFWLLLIGFHLCVNGVVPAQPHPLLWMALASVATLANAIALRESGNFFGRPLMIGLVVGAGGAAFGLTRLSSDWLTPALVAMSVATLSLAIFVNYRTITRSTSSSKAYQLPQLPVGIGTPVSR